MYFAQGTKSKVHFWPFAKFRILAMCYCYQTLKIVIVLIVSKGPFFHLVPHLCRRRVTLVKGVISQPCTQSCACWVVRASWAWVRLVFSSGRRNRDPYLRRKQLWDLQIEPSLCPFYEIHCATDSIFCPSLGGRRYSSFGFGLPATKRLPHQRIGFSGNVWILHTFNCNPGVAGDFASKAQTGVPVACQWVWKP